MVDTYICKHFQNDYQFDNDLTVIPYGELCSCTNLTVYSECNAGNPEIGSFNLIGEDEYGQSTYASLIDSNYQLYYNTTNNVDLLRLISNKYIT